MKRIVVLSVLLLLNTCTAAQKLNRSKMSNDTVKIIQEITLSAARKLTDYGLQLAAERNVHVSVAVTDRAGVLLAFVRMDDASLVTVDVAVGKARSAAYLKAPSKVFEDFINSGLPAMATTPGILPLQGGVPVYYKGAVIGAVGVSGADGDTDSAIAALTAAGIQ